MDALSSDSGWNLGKERKVWPVFWYASNIFPLDSN